VRLAITLTSEIARRYAVNAVMNAAVGLQVIIQQKGRSLPANAKFHAICTDLSEQATHLGRAFSPDQWKHLLVSAHAIENAMPFDPITGLAGEYLNIRESTARMSSARMASLIEYALYICAEKEVILHDPD